MDGEPGDKSSPGVQWRHQLLGAVHGVYVKGLSLYNGLRVDKYCAVAGAERER